MKRSMHLSSRELASLSQNGNNNNKMLDFWNNMYIQLLEQCKRYVTEKNSFKIGDKTKWNATRKNIKLLPNMINGF